MLHKFVTTAVLATILSAGLGHAQSLSRIAGPANLPPSGFSGQQFVDSRGCLFLRAGFGAQVNWVARIDRNRKPICGLPPTGSVSVAAVEEEAPVVAPPVQPPVRVAAAPLVVPPVAARPLALAPIVPPVMAAAAPIRVAPPVVVAPPVMQLAEPAPRQVAAPRNGSFFAMLFGPRTQAAPAPMMAAPTVPALVVPAVPVASAAPLRQPAYNVTTAPVAAGGAMIQCFTDAPQLERVALRGGGTALVCTRGDGSATGWRSPVFAQGGVGAALSGPAPMMAAQGTAQSYGAAPARTATAAIPKPPRGYKLAWQDDRLNPLRAQGTAQGQAQQDQVWTRDVPAVLVTEAAKAKPKKVRILGTTVTVSTMSAPTEQVVAAPQAQVQAQVQAQPQAQASAPAASGKPAYVQVGAFGQPANAEGAKARLAAMGLPVSTSKVNRGGKQLQVVYAGPFASRDQAQAALSAARGAGFGDAILR